MTEMLRGCTHEKIFVNLFVVKALNVTNTFLNYSLFDIPIFSVQINTTGINP